MILRPVSPQSPTGPPITKRPVGLMWYLVRSSTHSAGRTGLRISSITASRSALVEISGLCWGDRKSVVEGKSVDLGGRRIIKKKKKKRVVRLMTTKKPVDMEKGS